MRLRVCLLLGVLAGLTARQIPVWQTDVTLWGAAVRWNTGSPRPAFNYAVALRKAGRFDEAVPWLVTAGDRARGHPRERAYLTAIRDQFFALELSGYYACELPTTRLLCWS